MFHVHGPTLTIRSTINLPYSEIIHNLKRDKGETKGFSLCFGVHLAAPKGNRGSMFTVYTSTPIASFKGSDGHLDLGFLLFVCFSIKTDIETASKP